jgi:hypothetical protein
MFCLTVASENELVYRSASRFALDARRASYQPLFALSFLL